MNLTFSGDGGGFSADAAKDGAHGHEAEPDSEQDGDNGQDVRLLPGMDYNLVWPLPAGRGDYRLSRMDQADWRGSPVLCN
jgi:hypothetical protein